MLERFAFRKYEFNWLECDRIIRVIVGVALLALYFTSIATGALGIVFIVLGVLAVLTGAVGLCPLYALLKINTNKA